MGVLRRLHLATHAASVMMLVSRLEVRWRLCLWVAGIAVAARAIMVAVSAPPGGLEAVDESVAAANLLAGRGFVFEQYGTVYRAFKEPLYIVLVAGLLKWFGASTPALVAFQTSFGVAAALLMIWVSQGIFGDRRRAALAGTLTALNPFLIYYDTQIIYPLSLHACLFLATTGTIIVAVRQGGPTMSRVCWAAVVMGLTLWQRGIYLAAGIGSWLGALIWAQPTRRRWIIQAMICWLAVAVTIISPWLIRNYRLLDRVVLTTESAHLIWADNTTVPNAIVLRDGRRRIAMEDATFQRRLDDASELEQYDLFRHAAWASIMQDPARFVGLALARVKIFFWFSPTPGEIYTPLQRMLYRIAYLLLLGFGGLGLALHLRTAGAERTAAIILLSAVAVLAAAHALFLMNLKYRLPWELVLCLFAPESLLRLPVVIRTGRQWLAMPSPRSS